MKIIVPTDFSITSHNALITAKKFAKASHGEIQLLHVVELPSVSFSSIGEQEEDNIEDVFGAELIKKVDEELQALKTAHSDVKLTVFRKIGDAYKEIRDFIIWEKADMVIMGEKGLGDVDELFVGSITDKIIRTAKCPVISMNHHVVSEEFQNILYATDLNEEHPKLLALLMDIQGLFDSKLHLLKVNTKDNFSNDAETVAKLRTLADKYKIKNYTANSYSQEDEEYGIVYFADDIKANLIAIGVHKKTGFRRVLSGGGLPEEVVDHSHRPVLTYHFDANE